MSSCVLGLSAFYHDSAACLLREGEIVAAAQEERFTRRKHDPSFPEHAVGYCLETAGLSPADLDMVAFYDKPMLKFERLLETYVNYAPRGLPSFLKAMPLWLRRKLWIGDLVRGELEGFEGRMVYPEHHQSHAASAFFPSPFEEAAVITMDGVGEWATASWGTGSGNRVELLRELHFPHSLGLLYSAFTYYLGFRVNSGEYKVMGLAPYGEPRYAELILRELVDLREDGSFRLDMRYFNYCSGLTMTGRRFAELFGAPRREPESAIDRRHMDLAASVQRVTEEIVMRTARHVRAETGMRYLCMAGGVALNCVANGILLREGVFDDIWVQPAAGDAGGALGAALFGWHQVLGEERFPPRSGDRQRGSLLGPEWSDRQVSEWLGEKGCPHERLPEGELLREVAGELDAGAVVGWFQGRMEFGPRALGCRSILGDARSPEMQRRINLKVKFRESFRPFAPSVLEEEAGDYFELDRPSPYMLLVAPVRRERRTGEAGEGLSGFERLHVTRSDVPAVTHVDCSARVQTVGESAHPRYRALLRAFRELTGYGILVNTSFNVRGEPIVRSPEDAYACFMRTDMDLLVIGDCLLRKLDQPDRDSWPVRLPDGMVD